MKELREAKGFTHKDLAARINLTLKKWLESALREQGEDMRIAWRQRDEVLERVSVRPETVERWEKVGFGVQRGTRAAHKFYSSLAFVALVEVLDAGPDDMDKEMSNRTLQPGDSRRSDPRRPCAGALQRLGAVIGALREQPRA